MANIQCACTGNKIRLKKKSPDRAMANATSPCILGDPQTKGDKIRSGYLTPPFSGAQKRAEVLHHPCILGGPQRKARGQNQKWPTGMHFQ